MPLAKVGQRERPLSANQVGFQEQPRGNDSVIAGVAGEIAAIHIDVVL